MKTTRMNTNTQSPQGLLGTTLKFMGLFVIITFAVIIISLILIFTIPTRGTLLSDYIPITQEVDPENINWGQIAELEGWGVQISPEGQVLESYNMDSDELSEYWEIDQILEGQLSQNNSATQLVYKTPTEDYLLITYPARIVDRVTNINLDQLQETPVQLFFALLLILFILYIWLIYRLFRRLTTNLNNQVVQLRQTQEDQRLMLLRGIAHDVKTPLASIIAYSQALSDGIVQVDEQDNYLDTIHHNAQTLEDRVNEMLSLASIDQEIKESFQTQDILEGVRRFVGEHYHHYVDQGASFELDFSEQNSYITAYNPQLLDRLLQNLFDNSVQHNPAPVSIHIAWSPQSHTLHISDDGLGISDALQDTMFDAMVTSNVSRTGDKLRGMGLANVKRIVDLHGWSITYKDSGFSIRLK